MQHFILVQVKFCLPWDMNTWPADANRYERVFERPEGWIGMNLPAAAGLWHLLLGGHGEMPHVIYPHPPTLSNNNQGLSGAEQYWEHRADSLFHSFSQWGWLVTALPTPDCPLPPSLLLLQSCLSHCFCSLPTYQHFRLWRVFSNRTMLQSGNCQKQCKTMRLSEQFLTHGGICNYYMK